jgi:hypothetical protein
MTRFAKIGVTARAASALYAGERGLVQQEQTGRCGQYY